MFFRYKKRIILAIAEKHLIEKKGWRGYED